MLAKTEAQTKSFSEPLHFYRPFGESSKISSSILNSCLLSTPFFVWLDLGKRLPQPCYVTNTQEKLLNHTLFFFQGICRVMVFQNLDKDIFVLVICEVYSNPSTLSNPRIWLATRLRFTRTWCTYYLQVNKLMPAPLLMLLQVFSHKTKCISIQNVYFFVAIL